MPDIMPDTTDATLDADTGDADTETGSMSVDTAPSAEPPSRATYRGADDQAGADIDGGSR